MICCIAYDILFSMGISQKQEAVELRKQGYSYSYIQQKTGLAKSTLSYHLSKIPFVPNQYTKEQTKAGSLKSAKTKHKQKLAKLATAYSKATDEMGELCKRDVFIAGIALYAGEGSKTQNLVRLVNADPKIIIFFIHHSNMIRFADHTSEVYFIYTPTYTRTDRCISVQEKNKIFLEPIRLVFLDASRFQYVRKVTCSIKNFRFFN